MNDLGELFRSATGSLDPAPGALQRQHRAQRRRVLRRKAEVYALVAAVATIVLVWAASSFSAVTRPPRPERSGPPSLPERPIVFFGVSAVNPDGSGLVRLTKGVGSTPAWSPDGSKIVYAVGDVVNARSRGLAVMNSDGTDARPLTNGEDYLPDWSPDGTRIAFVRHHDHEAQVWVVDADGSRARQVTHLPGSIQPAPSWSPDGTRIVFAGGAASDGYIVNADGTGLENITAGRTNPTFQPQWSPDGTRIVFAGTSADGWGIYTMSPDGSDVHRLTSSDVGEYPRPVWSPDGRWIAFSDKHDPSSPSIEIMTANGQGLRRVVAGAGATQPSW